MIGRRSGDTDAPQIDLYPDTLVSRRHAQIVRAPDAWYLEDLGSRYGTRLNGRELLRGVRSQSLVQGDELVIGNTRVHVLEVHPVPRPVGQAAQEDGAPGGTAVSGSNGSRTSAAALETTAAAVPEAVQRVRFLQQLAAGLTVQARLTPLFRSAVEGVVRLIPAASGSSLLLADGQRVLAYFPDSGARPSRTLAARALGRALESSQSFCLEVAPDEPISQSARRRQIRAVIGAPLTWRGETLGVLIVESTGQAQDLPPEDMALIQAAADSVAAGLASAESTRKLQGHERLLGSLRRLIPTPAWERIHDRQEQLRIGGQFCEVTILFSDIRGFTMLSADMTPDDVTEMIRDYFGRLVPIVLRHHGSIDKYIGDAILAVFDREGRQHLDAVQAAQEMQAAVAETNEVRRAVGAPVGELGIGIHCGEVARGFIGADERLEFTVIGDSVNLASRYCDGAGPGEVLISPQVAQWIVLQGPPLEPTLIPTKHEGNLQAYRVRVSSKAP